jgi:hypothetical protein
MRYNPDTERGITIESIAEQGRNAILSLPKPPEREHLWHQGQWVKNPAFNPSLL